MLTADSMMDVDADLDTHICLACQVPILGLDNYVYHKKFSCPIKKRPLKSAKSAPDDVRPLSDTHIPNFQMSSQESISAVPQLYVFATGTDQGLQTVGPSHTSLFAGSHTQISPKPQALFGASSDLGMSQPGQLSPPTHTLIYMQPSCSTDLSLLVDGRSGPDHVSVTCSTSSRVHAITTFSGPTTCTNRFTAVDPNMVLCNLKPASDSLNQEPSVIMSSASDTNTTASLAGDHPSILDFLSSLDLQCRSTTGSEGKVMVSGERSEEDRTGIGNGLDTRMSDGLKLASLLNDLSFNSDSEGFDMPSDPEDLLNFDEDDLNQSFSPTETGKGKEGGHGRAKTRAGALKSVRKGRYIGKWRPGEKPHTVYKGMSLRPQSIGKRQYEEGSSEDECSQTVPAVVNAQKHKTVHENKSNLDQQNLPSELNSAHSKACKGSETGHEEAILSATGISASTLVLPYHTRVVNTTKLSTEDSMSIKTGQELYLSPCKETNNSPEATLPKEDHINIPQTPASEETNSKPSQYHSSKYKCEPCLRFFKSRSALHNHTRCERHQRLISLTDQQRKEYIRKSGIDVEESVNKPFVVCCPNCQRSFNNKYNFARHLLSSLHLKKTNSAIFQLDLSFQNLLLRLQPFQCRICQFFCASEEDLQLHLKSVQHKTASNDLLGPMCCVRCRFLSRSQSEMMQHFQSSHHLTETRRSDRPCVLREIRANITCPICSKKVHSATAMKKHVTSHDKSVNSQGSARRQLKTSVCPQCFKDCKTKYNMKVHIRRTHTHERPYSCDICKKRFIEQSTLNMHCKSQKHLDNVLKLSATVTSPCKAPGTLTKTAGDRSKVFKCKDCDFSCQSQSELRPHYIDEHSLHSKIKGRRLRKPSHLCEICGFKFMSKTLLNKHLQTEKHRDRERQAEATGFVGMPCTHCGHMYYSKEKLSLHLLSHMSAKIKPSIALRSKVTCLSGVPERFHEFVMRLPKQKLTAGMDIQCPECDGVFKLSNIVVHLRRHGDPDNQPYKCTFCTKTFTSNSTLYRHHKSHLGIRPFGCDVCSKSFKNKPQLESHQLSSHPSQTSVQPKYQCSRCGAKFVQKTRYTMHLRYHSQDKQYKCQVNGCGKSFVLLSSLNDHTRVHTGEKPFLCDLCGFATKTNTHMTRHKRVHTGECGYPCQYCTFKASHSWGLRRHMRIHIGCKPYKCPYCEYRCNCHTNLRHHVLSSKRHSGLPVYQCKLCDKGTNHAKEFRQHMILEHKVHESEIENICVYAGIYLKESDTASIIEGSQVLPVREKKTRRTSSQQTQGESVQSGLVKTPHQLTYQSHSACSVTENVTSSNFIAGAHSKSEHVPKDHQVALDKLSVAPSANQLAPSGNQLAPSANQLAPPCANQLAPPRANQQAPSSNQLASSANHLAPSANPLAPPHANQLAPSANQLASSANQLASSANQLVSSTNQLVSSANQLPTVASNVYPAYYETQTSIITTPTTGPVIPPNTYITTHDYNTIIGQPASSLRPKPDEVHNPYMYIDGPH